MDLRFAYLLVAVLACAWIPSGVEGRTCNMCNSMMGADSRKPCPKNEDYHPMTCGDIKSCLKFNGWYSTYNTTSRNNVTSDGEFRDCGSPDKLTLFLAKADAATDCYEVDFSTVPRVLPTRHGNINTLFKGRVCVCQGDSCNPASRLSTGLFGLGIVLMSFLKLAMI